MAATAALAAKAPAVALAEGTAVALTVADATPEAGATAEMKKKKNRRPPPASLLAGSPDDAPPSAAEWLRCCTTALSLSWEQGFLDVDHIRSRSGVDPSFRLGTRPFLSLFREETWQNLSYLPRQNTIAASSSGHSDTPAGAARATSRGHATRTLVGDAPHRARDRPSRHGRGVVRPERGPGRVIGARLGRHDAVTEHTYVRERRGTSCQ